MSVFYWYSVLKTYLCYHKWDGKLFSLGFLSSFFFFKEKISSLLFSEAKIHALLITLWEQHLYLRMLSAEHKFWFWEKEGLNGGGLDSLQFLFQILNGKGLLWINVVNGNQRSVHMDQECAELPLPLLRNITDLIQTFCCYCFHFRFFSSLTGEETTLSFAAIYFLTGLA